MKVVSVINYKGGVGKTTVTANLGAELAFRGFKVLLIDMDPQASLTFSFYEPEYWKKNLADNKTIKSWYEGFSLGDRMSLSSCIQKDCKFQRRLDKNDKGLLHVIPSHLGLINIDLELATELGGANLKQTRQKFLKVHRQLLDELNRLETNSYDIILIDCPPNFNIVTKTAIVASEQILVPAKPDYLSTLGIDYLVRNVNELVGEHNRFAAEDGSADIAPVFCGVVFTMVQYYDGKPISAVRPYIKQTTQLGLPVFESMFRENKTLFADAPQSGLPVVFVKQDNATHKRIQEEIEAFVEEFIRKVEI